MKRGNVVWDTEYDIYGKVRNLRGDRSFIPFRQLGQYEDVETGLYYNRFRCYSPDSGMYISQDPIGLAGNNPNLYAYVHDSNGWVDIFGLSEIFTSSNGLSLEVKNVQDLGHLSDKQLQTLYHANNNPKGFGKSPVNAKGETIVLHHQKQMNSGPIIEMPRSAHDLGNKKQHPFFPKPHPTDPVDRPKFDEWRKEYWKSRAEAELNKRGIKCH